MKTLKLRIYPNKRQKEQINEHINCCRFVYNWGLERRTKHYSEFGESISAFTLAKEITQLKKQETHKWLKNVNSQSLQQSLLVLDKAFLAFFRKQNAFPKFKSKHKSTQSCIIPQHFTVDFTNKVIKLPKIKYIQFRDKLNFRNYGEIKQISIVKEGQEYYACLMCETVERLTNEKPQLETSIGIDLGLKTYCTLSTGEKIDKPHFLKRSLTKLKLAQARKDKEQTRKIHKRVARQRKDFLQKLSTKIVENQDYKSIVIEDMDVSSILEAGFKNTNHAVADAGWRSFIEMLRYKCEHAGKNFVLVSPFEAASITCACGKKKSDLKLTDRVWTCGCGLTHDRDILAANNIRKFGTGTQNVN